MRAPQSPRRGRSVPASIVKACAILFAVAWTAGCSKQKTIIEVSEKILEFSGLANSDVRMIRGGFLSEEDRNKLIALAREGSVASRVTRRANALVLLDDGWSCQEVADAFLLNDDTIRGWFKLFEQRGIEGLTSFDVGGSASFERRARRRIEGLCGRDAAALDAPGRRLYRTGIGLVYESRSGLIALLHRLGLEYHKPDIIPRKLNKEKQQAFIESYDNL